jgi:hypothetical protein
MEVLTKDMVAHISESLSLEDVIHLLQAMPHKKEMMAVIVKSRDAYLIARLAVIHDYIQILTAAIPYLNRDEIVSLLAIDRCSDIARFFLLPGSIE